MAFPVGDPAELAHRLGLPVPPDPATLTRLESALSVAASQLDPRADPVKVDALPGTYLETLYQLALKVWDTGTRGNLSMDVSGGFDLAAVATSGMFRAVLGVAQPILKTGGVIVG